MLSPILIASSMPAFDLPLNHPNISTQSVHFFPCPSPEELAFRAPLPPNNSPASSSPTSTMGWLSDAASSNAHNASGSEETPASSVAELDSSPAAISLRRGEWLKAMETFPFAGTRAGRKNLVDDDHTERSTFTSISEVSFTPLRAVRRSDPYEEIGLGEEEGSTGTSKRITWPLSRSVSTAFLRRNTVGAESNPATSSEPQPSPSSSMFRFRSVRGATDLIDASRSSMVGRALSLRGKADSVAIQHLAETLPPSQAGDGKGEGHGAKDGQDDDDDEELDEATAEARRVAETIKKNWGFEEYTREEVFEHRFSRCSDSFDPEALASVADLPQL